MPAATVTAMAGTLTADLAVLLSADGKVRRIVPRAIGCPTVEQYASGLASQLLRSNTVAPRIDAWHRLAIVFAW